MLKSKGSSNPVLPFVCHHELWAGGSRRGREDKTEGRERREEKAVLRRRGSRRGRREELKVRKKGSVRGYECVSEVWRELTNFFHSTPGEKKKRICTVRHAISR